MAIDSGGGDTSTASAAAPGKQRRRNRPQHMSHDIAGAVHEALAAKQRDEERALATQTRRRKRALRKHKRAGQHTAGDTTADTAAARATQTSIPQLQRNDVVHTEGDDAAVIVVVVENLVDPDELEDSDEYEDIVADLEKDFRSHGRLLSLETSRDTGVVTLTYGDLENARAVVHEKHGKLFGGREVVARLIHEVEQQACLVAESEATTPAAQESVNILKDKDQCADLSGVKNALMNKKKKRRRSKVKNAVLREREKGKALPGGNHSVDASVETTRCKFIVCNLITSDEMEHEDEVAELQSDTRADFAAFGTLKDLEIVTQGGDDTVGDSVKAPSALLLKTGDVVVEYEEPDYAAAAFRAYDGKLFGGHVVECRWLLPTPLSPPPATEALVPTSHIVLVTNMLSPDELQDADEFEDLRDEVTELFERHGAIWSLEISRTSGAITVEYESVEAAQRAVAKVNQSIYGGRCMEAVIVTSDLNAGGQREAQKDDLFSTDASRPDRQFAFVPLQSELVDVVVQFLKRLASLQERAHQQNPLQDKRSRRLVLGLHEVKRGLLANKIRLLLVGTDMEECGILDEKVAEVLTIAHREQVPVIFPLTRRKLGRVLSKNVRVSCIGVYSFEGANDLFAEIIRNISSTSVHS